MSSQDGATRHVRDASALFRGLSGISLGLLAGVPLISSLLAVGSLAYLVPLTLLVVAAVLSGATSGSVTVKPAVAVYLVALVAFLTWMASTALWAIPGLGVADELQRLAGVLAFVVVAAFAFNEDEVVAGTYAIQASGILATGYVFWSYASEGSLGGYGVLQERYLIVAQLIGLGTVLAVLRAVTTNGRERAVNASSALVLLGGLGLSLARGALLSVIILAVMGTVYASWSQGSDRRSFRTWLRRFAARYVLFAGVLGAVALTIAWALRVERTRLRLVRLVTGAEFEGGRVKMWRAAWESIDASPVLGHGLGSSGVLSGGTPDLYPHNWALQVWLDGGIIGLVLCFVALCLPLITLVTPKRPRSSAAVSRWLPFAGAYVFLILEYSKSSDFYTARLLFVIGVMLIYATRLPDYGRRQVLVGSEGRRRARAAGFPNQVRGTSPEYMSRPGEPPLCEAGARHG